MMNRKYMYTIAAMLSLIIAITAISASSAAPTVVSNTTYGVTTEALTISGQFAGTTNGIIVTTGAGVVAAGGTTATAVEMLTTNPNVSPGVTGKNYAYKYVIAESAAEQIPTGVTTYKVQLFINGVQQGTDVFIKNAVNDSTTLAEGTTVFWDLGASVAAGEKVYEVKIT